MTRDARRQGRRHVPARAAAVLALAALGACAGGPSAPEAMEARVWEKICRRTELVALGDDVLRIEAKTGYWRDIASAELDALTRAAGEAKSRGAARFAIRHVDYDAGPMGALLVPRIESAETGYIGSYAALLEARAHQSEEAESFGRRSVVLVVELFDEEAFGRRRSFDAEAVYGSLMAERMGR